MRKIILSSVICFTACAILSAYEPVCALEGLATRVTATQTVNPGTHDSYTTNPKNQVVPGSTTNSTSQPAITISEMQSGSSLSGNAAYRCKANGENCFSTLIQNGFKIDYSNAFKPNTTSHGAELSDIEGTGRQFIKE